MKWIRILAVVHLMALLGCGSEDAAVQGPSEWPSVGVGQSGSQDFGRFRALVEAGELPSPDTLDPVGFFAEHKLELPPPDCENDVCLHGLFGIQKNLINGATSSIAVIGMNTAMTLPEIERPALSLALAVDLSGSMAGEPITFVKQGLLAMVDGLGFDDDISLIAYAETAEFLIRSNKETDPERRLLREQINALEPSGQTNIYAGLRMALEDVAERMVGESQARVILLSDGVATTGIADRDRILNLVRAHSRISISAIGLGDEFDLPLMRSISQISSGNFYFVEDPSAVQEVFETEISTFLVPIAYDATIELDVKGPYAVRGVYGVHEWFAADNAAQIRVPALYMASRTTTGITPDTGRRGGGGAIVIELTPIPVKELLDATPANHRVATATLSYRVPDTDEVVTQTVDLFNPNRPMLVDAEPYFDSPAVEKAFVTMNVYAALHSAVERASYGAPGAALSILKPFVNALDAWLSTHTDADIISDASITRKLIDIIEQREGPKEITDPPNPWAY